ncbi:unnamed protein product [Gongylonema pulchrum]|uniref:Uncharacterized protein n=1 Tax=Gongylonema pulchrum TaxID=637853 RepID=A0A183EBG4_9BILA|nr:unnamed protein product [Gongylonema pulchrum]
MLGRLSNISHMDQCSRRSSLMRHLLVQRVISSDHTAGFQHARPSIQHQPHGPVFKVTRFGPTNHQGVDAGLGYHPLTAPQLYAPLQLSVFLNVVACPTNWSEILKKLAEMVPDTDEARKQQNGAGAQNSVPHKPVNNTDDDLHDECMYRR